MMSRYKILAFLFVIFGIYKIYSFVFAVDMEKENIKESYGIYNSITVGEYSNISNVLNNASILKDVRDQSCDVVDDSLLNALIIEELLLSVVNGNSRINNYLNKNSLLVNSDLYGQDFVSYYKLGREFPQSAEKILLSLRSTNEFKEAEKLFDAMKNSKSDYSLDELKKLNNALIGFNCLASKTALGLIGEDSDFSEMISLIVDEMRIYHRENLNRALDEIRKNIRIN